MKIRLRVRTSPTESFEWEHPGPWILIGKEGCQLAFPGDPNVSRRHGEFGPATLVVHDANRAIRIRELQIHPDYDAEQPAAPMSIGHNFAVALLEGNLDAVCPLATEADIAEMNAQTPLLAVGYVDESTTREPYDRVKLLVRPQRLPTRVTASDPPGSDRPLSYQINVGDMETATGPLENMDGSPVFNDRGRVVGVLAILGKSFRLSSLDSVRDWLERIGP